MAVKKIRFFLLQRQGAGKVQWPWRADFRRKGKKQDKKTGKL
jgi:hypothetical protein